MMVDNGLLPYRDIFETTMPATFLFHYLVVALGLEGNTSFVSLGIAGFVCLSVLGSLILGQINIWAALLFAPAYLSFMLSFGPEALLQREVLGLAPVSLALLIATRNWQPVTKCLAIGFLFGFATLIKPQFALGAPVVVLAALAWPSDTWTNRLKGIGCSLLGFISPLLLTLVLLWMTGAIEQFLFILREYTPLYIQQTRTHEFVSTDARAAYLWNGWRQFGGLWTLLPGPIMLTILIWFTGKKAFSEHHTLLIAITILSFLYGLMPILSGQFWPYHYFLFAYFSLMALSGLLVVLQREFSPFAKWIGLGVVSATLLLQTPRFTNLEQTKLSSAKRVAEAKEMQVALETWLPSGARVQPLDWTSGTLHAMMLARAELATRFMYDFHFAHHVSHPTIQGLRSKFVEELRSDPPEALLEGLKATRVKGEDVSYDFPELEKFRTENYTKVAESERFALYRRADLGNEVPAQPK